MAYSFLFLSYANQGIYIITHSKQATILRAMMLSCIDCFSLLLASLQRLKILKSVQFMKAQGICHPKEY